MSNVPGIINLTSSVLRKLASYPVRSLIFIANVNPQLALNDYMTHLLSIELFTFRTRFLSMMKVDSRLDSSESRGVLNRKIVTCKSLPIRWLQERLRSVTKKVTLLKCVTS
jgi:hypothetical protein